MDYTDEEQGEPQELHQVKVNDFNQMSDSNEVETLSEVMSSQNRESVQKFNEMQLKTLDDRLRVNQ